MKLTIERAGLLKALGHVHSVVERRNTIPILANVLLEASDGRLSLTATDMDLAIVDTVPAEVEVASATTVQAHTLYDIVRKLPEGAQVGIDAPGGNGVMTIRAGRSTFSLATLPAEDFPKIASGELPHSFELAAAALRGLIDRTRFAISTEETRYYLNGIYLHAAASDKVSVLRTVATDGHRLARCEMALPAGAERMPGIIVPRKTVNEVRKLIDGMESPVQLSLSDTRLRIASDGVVLISKLIDGSFPDYERVIPTGNDKVMEVACRDFAAAVDRVATIATEKSRAVKLSVGRNHLTVSATSPDAGSASEEIEVSYGAAPIEIGFNSRYLLDITEQIEGEAAEFAMADPGSPTVVRDSADRSAALYVLMPLRV